MLPVPVVHGEHGRPDDGRRQWRLEKLRRGYRLMHGANGHNHERAEGPKVATVSLTYRHVWSKTHRPACVLRRLELFSETRDLETEKTLQVNDA